MMMMALGWSPEFAVDEGSDMVRLTESAFICFTINTSMFAKSFIKTGPVVS